MPASLQVDTEAHWFAFVLMYGALAFPMTCE